MLDFSTVTIDSLVIHRVGNKHNEENFFISQTPVELTEDMSFLLLDYFVKPFMNLQDVNHFHNEVDLNYNELFGISTQIFQAPESLYINSIKILKHLQEQSNHPHIKTGDVFIAHFSDLLFEDRMVNAIGIFKSENKTSFLQIDGEQSQLHLQKIEGIDVKKLDKGCLIINDDMENGGAVFSVDSNNYDAEYWTKNFLNIAPRQDEYFHTKEYVSLVKGYAKEIVQANENRTEEINFLNKSVKFLEENQEIDIEEFKATVFEDDAAQNEFDDYKKMFETQKNVVIPDAFVISKPVLEKQKKQIKNLIKLDTNIQIKIAVNNVDSTSKFVEQGYDVDKEMNYYKIYYNREVN